MLVFVICTIVLYTTCYIVRISVHIQWQLHRILVHWSGQVHGVWWTSDPDWGQNGSDPVCNPIGKCCLGTVLHHKFCTIYMTVKFDFILAFNFIGSVLQLRRKNSSQFAG